MERRRPACMTRASDEDQIMLNTSEDPDRSQIFQFEWQETGDAILGKNAHQVQSHGPNTRSNGVHYILLSVVFIVVYIRDSSTTCCAAQTPS